MSNVLQFGIDPDIKLGPECDDMPDEIKGGLLSTMTHSCKKHNCHWTELEWRVKIKDGQPIIYVNKRKP